MAPPAPRDLPWPYLLLAVLVGYLPFVVLGYGTDIDVANVLRAGESMLDGDYTMSRGPGAAPHEVATALLDRLGGPILVNLVAVAFALLAVWCVHRLLDATAPAGPSSPRPCSPPTRGSGWRAPRWATSPGPSPSGWPAPWRRRPIAGCWPALLFGLGIGCRASTVLLGLSPGWWPSARVTTRTIGRRGPTPLGQPSRR